MCGRITFRASGKDLATLFDLIEAPDLELEPRYNIAPTQPVLAVRQVANGSGRELVRLRWGLIPVWSKDLKIGYKLINARAETVASTPAFRSAFKGRRCLVAADGYYEWQQMGKAKQPYFFHRHDDRPFAFAGLWERWESPEGELVESCTIVTTGRANSPGRSITECRSLSTMPTSAPGSTRPESWSNASRCYDPTRGRGWRRTR